MRLPAKLSGLLLSASTLVVSVCAAQAATVSIFGGIPPFPGYGTNVGQNNVVNNGLSGVSDPIPNGSLYFGSVSGNPAFVTTTLGLYNVDWYFVGAESGFVNTLVAPGINPTGSLANSPVPGRFNEANQNSNCCSPGPATGPLFLGTSVAQTSSILNFTLMANGSSVTNGPSNKIPGSGIANLVFAYLAQNGPLSWTLTSTPGDWFLFGFNDNGGPDDNHDDFMGVARVYVSPVPLPAALPLFASGLGVMAWMARRKKRKVAA